LEDGNLYSVQFVERARLEVHGEAVMLGRGGAEAYTGGRRRGEVRMGPGCKLRNAKTSR
jgi:hypothetical protein